MKLKIKKGLNLNIEGALPANVTPTTLNPTVCAIVPDDFPGFVPKPALKEGEAVAVGTPVLYDKNNPDVKLVSPLAGKVKAVVRGERRKILRVEIESTESAASVPAYVKAEDAATAKKLLAESGLLALMRQRPYDIVPNPADDVRDVFVTAVYSAPLEPGAAFFNSVFGKAEYEAGVALLGKVTKGKVYVCYGADYTEGVLKGAEMVELEGPHPVGNVGVQIANIAPVNKGETVWTLDLFTLGRIGRLVLEGRFDPTVMVAVVGPEVSQPGCVKTVIGAPVRALTAGKLAEDKCHKRVISGNVLTGIAVGDGEDSFLRYPYRQITVIAEGDDVDEFMGWASMSPAKMSNSRSFPGHFLRKAFRPDARVLGGRRAMIMSGEFDEVMPMDILPEYLLKAIIAKDIDQMEKLGIYEVAPEDFALAEYVDTSKMPLQQIVRDGLEYLRKELS